MNPWFDEYLAAKTPGPEWNAAEELTVRACIHAADDANAKQYAVACADAFIQAGACTAAHAKPLFFAMEQTGDDKYRLAILQVMAELEARQEEDPDLAAANETLPFRMAYEMKLNRMEKVGQTAALYRKVHQRLWDAQRRCHQATLQEEAWFLMALMDGVEVCSDQLYEHWRTLVDIYRETLRGMLPLLDTADVQTVTVFAYAILRGVAHALIDPERYLPVVTHCLAVLRCEGKAVAADMLEEMFGVA